MAGHRVAEAGEAGREEVRLEANLWCDHSVRLLSTTVVHGNEASAVSDASATQGHHRAGGETERLWGSWGIQQTKALRICPRPEMEEVVLESSGGVCFHVP